MQKDRHYLKHNRYYQQHGPSPRSSLDFPTDSDSDSDKEKEEGKHFDQKEENYELKKEIQKYWNAQQKQLSPVPARNIDNLNNLRISRYGNSKICMSNYIFLPILFFSLGF